MPRAPKSSPTPRAPDAPVALLAVQVVPGASRTEVIGRHGSAIRIRINAPPVDGRANAALVEAIARWLGVPRSAVGLVSGASGRSKRVRVEGLATADAERHLLELTGAPS
jgi:uncharacterized protein (TIGR00251 family)